MMQQLCYAASVASCFVAWLNLLNARRQPSTPHGRTWGMVGLGYAVLSIALTALAYVGTI